MTDGSGRQPTQRLPSGRSGVEVGHQLHHGVEPWWRLRRVGEQLLTVWDGWQGGVAKWNDERAGTSE